MTSSKRWQVALWCVLLVVNLSSGEVRKEHRTHAKCGVCNFAVIETHRLAIQFTEVQKLNRKNEDEVLDFVANVCRQGRREGRWLRMVHIESREEGRTLKVLNATMYGECRGACLLARAACEDAFKNQEDLFVELLRADTEMVPMQKKLCTSFCEKELKPLKTPYKDEQFVHDKNADMLHVQEEQDRFREETGKVMFMKTKEEMAAMSDEDKRLIFARDRLGQQLGEARERSGRDWHGREINERDEV